MCESGEREDSPSPISLRFLLRSWPRAYIPVPPRGACTTPFARDAFDTLRAFLELFRHTHRYPPPLHAVDLAVADLARGQGIAPVRQVLAA